MTCGKVADASCSSTCTAHRCANCAAPGRDDFLLGICNSCRVNFSVQKSWLMAIRVHKINSKSCKTTPPEGRYAVQVVSGQTGPPTRELAREGTHAHQASRHYPRHPHARPGRVGTAHCRNGHTSRTGIQRPRAGNRFSDSQNVLSQLVRLTYTIDYSPTMPKRPDSELLSGRTCRSFVHRSRRFAGSVRPADSLRSASPPAAVSQITHCLYRRFSYCRPF